jgi:branched-chain amino acid transport system substrate-binding protein
MLSRAVLLLGIVFSGICGQAIAADRTGVTRNSIKIGLFGPITGPSSAASKTLYGAAAIYKDVNARGGINGRSIELVIEDDGCDPEKGVAAARKLLDQDRVFLIHGAYCSAVALAVKAEMEKKRSTPYVVLAATSAKIVDPILPNVYLPTATSKIAAAKMAEFALSKPGAKKIAVVRHSDDWGTGYFNLAQDRMKELGVTPVKVALFERGGIDASPAVLAIKEAAPDAVLAFLYPNELAVYLRDAYKHGLRTTTVGTLASSINDTDKQIGIPEAMSDVYLAYNLSGTLTSPQLSRYAHILKENYPSQSIDTQSFDSMGGALAIVEALKRTGRDVSRERFIKALDGLKDFDTGVQGGHLTFSPADHAGLKTLKIIGLVKGKPRLFDRYPSKGEASVRP